MDEHSPGLLPEPAIFSNEAEADSCDCDGECCHEHTVLLTHHDVRRILQGVDIDPRELVVFFRAREGYVDLEVLGGYPAILMEGEACYMGLRFVVDDQDTRRHCRFLDHATNRCGIHAFKPMVCRAYPFLILDGRITRHKKIRCKHPFHPRTNQAIASLRMIIQEAYREFEEFKGEVTRWNGSTMDDSFNAFFREFIETDRTGAVPP
nr:YkgJ family cysteine cluster protein [Candidatus Sigynarchaeum springense]